MLLAQTCRLPLLLAYCLLLFVAPAGADEVRLKNGDRLTGELIRMDKELLTLRSGAVDARIHVNWEEIACFSTDRETAVELKSGELVTGTVSCTDGNILIDSPRLGTSKEIPLAQIEGVNPSIYSGYFVLGGSLAGGNSDTFGVGLATRFKIKTKKHRFTVDAKYNYGTADGDTNTNNSLGNIKYDLFTTEKIYSYAQSMIEKDEMANLDLRNTEGLGFGYQFSDTRRLVFALEGGLSFFYEQFTGQPSTTSAALRWAGNFEWEAIRRLLHLYVRHEGYYTPDNGRVTLRQDQGLFVPMLDDLAMNLGVDYRYNSKPDPGKGPSDVTVTFGITYEYAYW